MKIAAISLSRSPQASQPVLAARLPDFVALMKPRVMALAVFTALVGLTIAPVRLDPLLELTAILAIAAGAGAAGALNMGYDADIDAVMARTAGRPIPRGSVSPRQTLIFGLFLACGAIAVLAAIDLKAAALLAFAIFFYIVVYTIWLKRRTPQNIVIGGAAGALPPVIGWVAASSEFALEPFILFLIIFLWTPPHFWALSLNRADDYARAGVPMLPIVAGRAETTRRILIYSILLFTVYTMAGMATRLHLQADHPGIYRGMSANYSGAGFADMIFNVEAIPAEGFEQWAAATRAAGPTLDAQTYAELAKPSRAVTPFTYRAVAPELFGDILSAGMHSRDPLQHTHPASQRAGR